MFQIPQLLSSNVVIFHKSKPSARVKESLWVQPVYMFSDVHWLMNKADK